MNVQIHVIRHPEIVDFRENRMIAVTLRKFFPIISKQKSPHVDICLCAIRSAAVFLVCLQKKRYRYGHLHNVQLLQDSAGAVC